ncbi:MAG: hypothetical protein LBU66_01760 [Treponema sp.]|jgi:hypothetical protein|nr:hypothetical protein [Treponema sp.]
MSHKKVFFKLIFAIILFSMMAAGIGAQENGQEVQESELPRQFRELALGMNLDDLKTTLLRDGYFNFRGDRDVSFLPAREQSLVETTGSTFIRRAFFQLRDSSVFIMSFSLNTEIIDHYSVFMQFSGKYGEPLYLDPRIAIWETEETRISIERPLTVKYIDKIVFDDILNESGLVESNQVWMRQEFLNEF